MTRYVALMRGINIGGNKQVEMKRLKALFESLRCQSVSTYINSGNVLFETDESDESALANHIEHGIHKTFGFEVPILLRKHQPLIDLANNIPKIWKNDTEQKTDVLFLWKGHDQETSLNEIKTTHAIDRLLYIDRAIIWNIDRKNYSKSGMNDFIKSPLYKHMTARNCNTVRKLAVL